MSEEPLSQSIKELLTSSVEEIRKNLVIIAEINADLRTYYYTNKETLSPDKRRQIGTYLKGYMDIKIRALLVQLVDHLKVVRQAPTTTEEALPASEIDKAIDNLSPYDREKLRTQMSGSPV